MGSTLRPFALPQTSHYFQVLLLHRARLQRSVLPFQHVAQSLRGVLQRVRKRKYTHCNRPHNARNYQHIRHTFCAKSDFNIRGVSYWRVTFHKTRPLHAHCFRPSSPQRFLPEFVACCRFISRNCPLNVNVTLELVDCDHTGIHPSAPTTALPSPVELSPLLQAFLFFQVHISQLPAERKCDPRVGGLRPHREPGLGSERRHDARVHGQHRLLLPRKLYISMVSTFALRFTICVTNRNHSYTTRV